ncbi:hypothetical protein SynSYN20_01598 [Synechococcus sp. SYN20]|uniref:hypothetical protein n=1 Tax=Synechococcus sp. SYN20 TaxID=1050714 RepID=UPI0016448BFB|nr:hypothetical protein [Synechococcus sp. SYN20]QNJ25925.1 hypothetical protein SynSYN20_01598 [Synechococcus sp. SYN20]
MEVANEIVVYDMNCSCISLVVQVTGFKHLGGNAWQPNVSSVEAIETYSVPYSLEARVNEAITGNACMMGTVPGWEATSYRYDLLNGLAEQEGNVEQTELIIEEIINVRATQAKEHRASKKDIVKTVSLLLEAHCQPELFILRDGREMLRRAINQGFINRQDLEDTLLVPYAFDFNI